MMNLLRRDRPKPSKVIDPMKTPTLILDSTTLLSAGCASARRAGVARLGRATLACLSLSAMTGASMAIAQQTAPVPQTVIVADFNQDGIPDALVESTATPTATIAFGSVPYGTFGANAKVVNFPAVCVSSNSDSLVVGDFNGDGFPDIAFFCNGASGVVLGVGDGTFGAVKSFTGAVSAKAVVGDFNHDGKLDVVVLGLTFGPNTTTIGTLQFFAGNGDGTFLAPINTALDQITYSSPVVADLNGDGFPDLALINIVANTSGSLSIFGNNLDGTFGAIAQGVASPNTQATLGPTASTILAGNFFSTTSTDLAVASTGANADISVFKNTSTGTTFSLADPVTNPYTNMTGAKAGKFTGSGFTDIAVSNGTSIAVLANDGRGNLAASYPTLTLTSATPLFAAGDANNDGYADIYMAALPASGALQLVVNLTTGSATATSQPFSLPVGTSALSAAWTGNANFAGSNASGSQVVVGIASATTVVSSKNPSMVGDAVAFSIHVAPMSGSGATPTGTVVLTDGTAMLGSGPLDGNGNFTYMTSALTQATHPVTASYAGDTTYSASTGTISQVVNRAAAVTVSSFTPNTATIGSPATTITVTGAGFSADSVVQVNGTAIATTVVNATTLTAVIPAADFTAVGTLQITVSDPSLSLTSQAVSFSVTAAPLGAVLSAPPTTDPGTQPTINFTITQPYPVDISATLTLGFAASTTPPIDDPSIQFAEGGRSLTFVVPANTVTVPTITLQAGTVAGTITVPITLTAGGTNVTPTNLQPAVIVVPPAAPEISSSTLTRSGKQLTVVIHGFSNTREVTNAKFHFTPATGATLGTTDLTVPGDTIFNTKWFQTTDSDQYGSTFTYTQIFNTSDDAMTIGSVDVTLSNSVGASDMKTAQ